MDDKQIQANKNDGRPIAISPSPSIRFSILEDKLRSNLFAVGIWGHLHKERILEVVDMEWMDRHHSVDLCAFHICIQTSTKQFKKRSQQL